MGESLNRAWSASDGTKRASALKPRAGAWGSDQKKHVRVVAISRPCYLKIGSVGVDARNWYSYRPRERTIKTLRILKGIASYIPGRHGSGTEREEPLPGRYYYSVWLRHLVKARENGLDTCPRVVAELGPGDALGLGMAALLSGADQYYALDAVRYAAPEANLRILDELVSLFRSRAGIPNGTEYPKAEPRLSSYDFPGGILSDKLLSETLAEERVNAIRQAVTHLDEDARGSANTRIRYFTPWCNAVVIARGSVDAIYSQAVLEHVDDLPKTYRALNDWLKPGGYMSHAIDFKCHGTAGEWNGHWTYSDISWRLIRGKRPYLLNREPYSTHEELARNAGFQIVRDERTKLASDLSRRRLARRFRRLSDDDLTTGSCFVQAIKLNNIATSIQASTPLN